MERITGRLNWNQRFLDDKLMWVFKLQFLELIDDQPPVSGRAGFQGDILGAAYSANPTWPKVPGF